MSQNFQAGDYLIFQIESGYGLLRILAVDVLPDETIYHLAAYNELFLDVEFADQQLENSPQTLTVNLPHVALTERAFLSTQTARMKNIPLNDDELKPLNDWRTNADGEISDRSIRLMMGLR